MSRMNEARYLALEATLDACGFEATLIALSDICAEKADHARETFTVGSGGEVITEWEARRRETLETLRNLQAINVTGALDAERE